jgi:hypothetical protein
MKIGDQFYYLRFPDDLSEISRSNNPDFQLVLWLSMVVIEKCKTNFIWRNRAWENNPKFTLQYNVVLRNKCENEKLLGLPRKTNQLRSIKKKSGNVSKDIKKFRFCYFSRNFTNVTKKFWR